MINDVYVIAEAGVNHNGCIERALEMVRVAKECGADAVKFQTFKANTLVSKSAPLAKYQERNVKDCDSQFELIRRLELSESYHKVLMEECKRQSIDFMSTPFDIESALFLQNLGMSVFKIPSGEITNLPYLEVVASLGKPIILSTGMSELDEVKRAVDLLLAKGSSLQDLTVLHCTTQYPTPMEEVNLKAMLDIQESLKCAVGYSDHTLGIEVPMAAVSLGAQVIEKHFTLDRKLDGPDHLASLEPAELEKMIEGIRNLQKALGEKRKTVVECERPNQIVARKSIVASRVIQKGELFTVENLTTKRPGNGISPWKWYELLGKTSRRYYGYDELIEENEVLGTDNK